MRTYENSGGEHAAQPSPVQFIPIALHALEGGIFAVDEEARLTNRRSTSPVRLPESMLETPYGNGPARIERNDEDVPVAAMNQVRKNFARANQLLLPRDEVLRYFHERFARDEPFLSAGMSAAAQEYAPILNKAIGYQDAALSFRIDDADRTTRRRRLFTEDEIRASIELARDYPASVLTVVAYAGTIQDYLYKLGYAFEALSHRPEYKITAKNLADYRKFAENWNTSNFTAELMPSLALHLNRAHEAQPQATTDSLLTSELFHQAVDFVIANGAFRNFVAIPDYVAIDGVARVNHFLCPAVSAIREQLLDGSLLYAIYRIADARLAAGDKDAQRLADTLSARAARRISEHEAHQEYLAREAAAAALPMVIIETEGKNEREIIAEAISKALEKEKPAVFVHDGRSYSVAPGAIQSVLAFEQPQQRGDIVIILHAGQWLYAVIREAVERALADMRPVFFRFNDVPYRIQPDKVLDVIAQSQQ